MLLLVVIGFFSGQQMFLPGGVAMSSPYTRGKSLQLRKDEKK